ncbi:putative sugar transferase [Campylobacter coli H9]|uniref:hypothetical protein n=1 Tax=Campylobacter coli TaxID=195 RepID=UPI0002581814|nr:hypothetical protein [Campylobacter coli]EIB12675.1 putative sugar transferase [Campylobacter coli H9]
MKKYNVVLLGGSNSVMVNGLQKGLRQENVNLTNLALGACSSIQNLYELKRERNREFLDSADLIITESNINEIEQNWFELEKLPLSLIYRNLTWMYRELSYLNKKILVIILPYQKLNYKIINSLHRRNCVKYGFNLIDMQSYYEENNLEEFGNRIDPGHQQSTIMKNLGENIIKKIDSFKLPNFIAKVKNPEILIVSPSELQYSDSLVKIHNKNSMYDELVYRITSIDKLKFPKKFLGYFLIGMHTWNTGKIKQKAATVYSSLAFRNNDKVLIKEASMLNSVQEIRDRSFIIDDNSYVGINMDNLPCNEKFGAAQSYIDGSKNIDYCDVVNFILAKYNYFDNKKFAIDKMVFSLDEYNFNHLIPPIEFYKEIIDEYCAVMDSKKLSSMQKQFAILNNEKQEVIAKNFKLQTRINQFQEAIESMPVKKQQLEISSLEQDLINKKLQAKQLSKKLGIKMNDFMPKITMIYPNSAKIRIQNQLSYKLGQAMIVNSKSILGYIRMPFVLSYIYDKHKQEQKIYQEKIKKDSSLILPPLESYPDYKEALKEKKCFTYKLGQELIKANKNWYGGGYIKLLLEIRKLKREYNKKRIQDDIFTSSK